MNGRYVIKEIRLRLVESSWFEAFKTLINFGRAISASRDLMYDSMEILFDRERNNNAMHPCSWVDSLRFTRSSSKTHVWRREYNQRIRRFSRVKITGRAFSRDAVIFRNWTRPVEDERENNREDVNSFQFGHVLLLGNVYCDHLTRSRGSTSERFFSTINQRLDQTVF